LIIKNGQKVKKLLSTPSTERSSNQDIFQEANSTNEQPRSSLESSDGRIKTEVDFASTILNADVRFLRKL